MGDALPRFVVWVLQFSKWEIVRQECVFKEDAVFLKRGVRVAHSYTNRYELLRMIGCVYVEERAGMVVICYYPKAGSGLYMNSSSHATKEI